MQFTRPYKWCGWRRQAAARIKARRRQGVEGIVSVARLSHTTADADNAADNVGLLM